MQRAGRQTPIDRDIRKTNTGRQTWQADKHSTEAMLVGTIVSRDSTDV
jgi:hypothetical protein